MLKQNNYLVIQAYMVNELQLKGNELLVYAIINGFSQEENCWFTGSLSYICDFINCKSKTTVMNILKSLVDRGLIEKEENILNNVKFCKYRTVYQNLIWGISKNDMGGISKIDTNNKYIYNKKNNISKDILSKENEYFTNLEVNKVFIEFLEMRDKIKAVNSERAIKALINKLNKYEDSIKIQMIEKSIINSWKDVFEIPGTKPIESTAKKLPVFNDIDNDE